MKIKGCQRDCR